jgi:hypothetical protein
VRSNFIVLGFAPMTRFPREGVPQDEGAPCLPPQVGQPLPGENACACDDEVLALGGAKPSERFGRRGQILLNQERARLLEDTDVQRLRM